MTRLLGFVQETQNNANLLLQIVDSWSGLQQENSAMGYATSVDQTTLDTVFGAGVFTQATYLAALTAMQSVVDSVHVPATAQKLYKMKK